MKRNRPRTLLAGLLLLAALAAGGCSTAPPDTEKRLDAGEKRLAALEIEVRQLAQNATARETALRDELAGLRTDLGAVRALLETRRTPAQAKPSVEDNSTASDDALDRELDAKAKGFVKENLDHLLAITRKLLDKMERELDKQEQPAPPQSKGGGI